MAIRGDGSAALVDEKEGCTRRGMRRREGWAVAVDDGGATMAEYKSKSGAPSFLSRSRQPPLILRSFQSSFYIPCLLFSSYSYSPPPPFIVYFPYLLCSALPPPPVTAGLFLASSCAPLVYTLCARSDSHPFFSPQFFPLFDFPRFFFASRRFSPF